MNPSPADHVLFWLLLIWATIFGLALIARAVLDFNALLSQLLS